MILFAAGLAAGLSGMFLFRLVGLWRRDRRGARLNLETLERRQMWTKDGHF